jgi:hypothetical protein
MYNSWDDGLYFWHTAPRPKCPEGPLLCVNSNKQDVLLDGQPQFDAHIAHVYANSNWATCGISHGAGKFNAIFVAHFTNS